MDWFYLKVYEIFQYIIQYSTLLLECVGVGILIFSAVRALAMLIRHKGNVRLTLAEGIALSLEFKLGGELLQTVMIEDWEELLKIGGIILLRAAMTFLIQWEIRIEKRDEEHERELRAAEEAAKEAKKAEYQDIPTLEE